MLGSTTHPTLSIRGASALFLAVALILPPPAHCAICDAAAANCSQCELAAANQPPAVRPCCRQHAAAHAHSALVKDNCVAWQPRTCNCNIRPIDRSVVSSEQISLSHQLAIASSPAPLLAEAPTTFETAVTAFANLPPPVPHRVLHCSWII